MTNEPSDHDSLSHAQSEIFSSLTNISEAVLKIGKSRRINSRAILGGSFGFAGYELCSTTSLLNGLDVVVYFVRESDSGFIIGSANTKDECIKQARSSLQLLPSLDLKICIACFKANIEKIKADKAPDETEVMRFLRKESTKQRIPKRRQQIFDSCNGKCYYCGCELSIAGRWHIDHKMPKALLGDNSPQNLVAACAPCNHKKRDTTDQEFLSQLRSVA